MGRSGRRLQGGTHASSQLTEGIVYRPQLPDILRYDGRDVDAAVGEDGVEHAVYRGESIGRGGRDWCPADIQLGAIRFERDVRSIANYLSSQTNFGGAREKFTRLQQIATVLNLDDDEDAEDFYSNSGIPWRLSKSEFNAVVELRL